MKTTTRFSDAGVLFINASDEAGWVNAVYSSDSGSADDLDLADWTSGRLFLEPALDEWGPIAEPYASAILAALDAFKARARALP